jgi:hypothetical protein
MEKYNNSSNVNKGMKKSMFVTLGLLFVLAISLTMVSANLGTFKQNSCIDIQTVLNTSAVNISSLTNPTSLTLARNIVMTKNGYTFNYTNCQSSIMGSYNYGYVELDGNSYSNSYEVTSDGLPYSNFPVVYVLIVLAVIFLILGRYQGKVFKSDVWETFAGILLMVAGILTLSVGFNYVNSTNLAGLSLGCVLIGIGAIITYYSNSEVFN